MLDAIDFKREHQVVFCTEVGGMRIIYRPLTRAEYDTYTLIFQSGLTTPGKVQDRIFREVVLDRGLIDMMGNLPAGLVPSIVDVVFYLSGFVLQDDSELTRLNQGIQALRQEVQSNIWEFFTVEICRAFPSYTPEDLRNKSIQEFLRLLVMAEKINEPDTPYQVVRAKKKQSLTDRAFEDARRAAQVDAPGGPKNLNIKDQLRAAQRPDLSTEQARQIEMIRRIHEQRGE